MLILKKDTWLEIFHALDKNKVRTLITMIGVAWGMLLFVFLLGIVNGLRNGFDRDLKGTSTNSLFMWTQRTSIPFYGFGRGRTFTLKVSDVEAIKTHFKEVKIIVPRNRKTTFIKNNIRSGHFTVYGDYPEQNKMFVKKISYGRFIAQNDQKNSSKVVVIGSGIVDDLYQKGINPIGSTLEINNIPFTVIGVYDGNQGNFEGTKSMFIPFATFQKIFNQVDNVGLIAVNIQDNMDINNVETRLKNFLKKRHNIHPNDTQAFGSFNLGEIFGKIFNFMKGLELLTIIVGFLTLLAGVIAVSSILLITVKERTKEFGIRRALGAKPKQIISQILLESAVITFFSGLIGIIMGTLILSGINSFVNQQSSLDNKIPLVNSSVDVNILLGSFLLVLIMAILAGLIPASRAIAIKPIDALREE